MTAEKGNLEKTREGQQGKEERYDIVVIGGGPAGYIAAIKAARLGKKTALAEKSVVGGTCLNRGCIPTKAYLKTAELIHALRGAAERGINIAPNSIQFDMAGALQEKNRVVKKLTGGVSALLKSNGVTVFAGEARVKADKTITIGERTISADKVILAGGSKAARLNLAGMDSARVMTSDEILDINEVPDIAVIIGGGVIGVEMASVLAAFGSKVTIIEIMDRILPLMDTDVSDAVAKSLKSMGILVHTGTKLERVQETEDGIEVFTDKQPPIHAACALLSVGRVPDLSAVAGLEIATERGYVQVDDYMRSSIDWIYAPGDINGRMMLAHAAFHMGEVAALNAAGHTKKADLKYIPSCVYTMPEVGCVGLTQDQAAQSYDISVGYFPFGANGRALASGDTEGFVKLIADKKYGEVLGVHIVGPSAAEIINEAAALMAMEITVHEIAHISHAHPAFAEAFMEAAADAVGESLHLPPRQ